MVTINLFFEEQHGRNEKKKSKIEGSMRVSKMISKLLLDRISTESALMCTEPWKRVINLLLLHGPKQ